MTAPKHGRAPPAGRERRRTLAGFAAFGLFWGVWGAVLPAVKTNSAVTDGQLGVALLMIGLGALLSMRLTGIAIDRHGAAVLPIAMLLFGVCGVLPAFAGSAVGLTAALFVLGAASGATDVAINAEGVRAEAGSARPLLNLAHGWFSICVVLASLATAVARAAGAGLGTVLAAVFVFIAVITGIALAPGSLRGAPAAVPGMVQDQTHTSSHRNTWRIPRPLIIFGFLGTLAYLIENAWQSWSAVHLETTFGAAAGLASTAPAVFAAAAGTGRIAGNLVARRFDPIRLLTGGALIASAGTAMAATAGTTWLALGGIAIAGLGTSVCAPTIISLAGAWAGPQRRGSAISTVTTLAYLGFLLGPASVGVASSLTSLPAALAGVAGVALLLACLGSVIPRGRRS